MNKELDQKLCQSYPFLYRDRTGGSQQTLMSWGFACGDGWYPLLDSISLLVSAQCPEMKAVQVKEKFGSLRFYYVGGDSYCRGVVSMAGTLSGTICEVCGAVGLLGLVNGWVSCRCIDHARPGKAQEEGRDRPGISVYGLGLGWSHLVLELESSIQWQVEKNGMPPARLTVGANGGHLSVGLVGGNEEIRGMAALISHYARRIDPRSGRLLQPIGP